MESTREFDSHPNRAFIGRTFLITGAARGIGRATALAAARSGADLLICDRLEEELDEVMSELEALAVRVDAEILDVRDTDKVANWLDRIGNSDDWDGVDVLVNNAGGGFFASVEQLSPNGQAALIAENFTQVVNTTRDCLPLLREALNRRVEDDQLEQVSVINITSVEGHRAGPGFGIYSAMKAALENLTKTLALELAAEGIRVNAIAPDMIPTEGDSELAEASQAMSDTAWLPTPLGHFGEPNDVAQTVLWLASDAAKFITGTTIHVDGGTFAASGWKQACLGQPWKV